MSDQCFTLRDEDGSAVVICMETLHDGDALLCVEDNSGEFFARLSFVDGRVTLDVWDDPALVEEPSQSIDIDGYFKTRARPKDE